MAARRLVGFSESGSGPGWGTDYPYTAGEYPNNSGSSCCAGVNAAPPSPGNSHNSAKSPSGPGWRPPSGY